MESITTYRQLVEGLCSQAREQMAALTPLSDLFLEEAERLFRHDQIVYLHCLKARVLHEVDRVQSTETAASYAFTKATLLTGTAKLALGGLVAVVAHSRKALSVWAHLAHSDLSKDQPFGTVLVTVGHGGLPNDVEVIPLSRLARASNSSESDIEAALQARGSLLMTPEAFSHLVDELEAKVLDGSLALPVASEQLSSGWTSH